jgi:hypothetical protein
MAGFMTILIDSVSKTLTRQWVSKEADIATWVGPYTIGITLPNDDIILVNKNSFLDPNMRSMGFSINERAFLGNGMIVRPEAATASYRKCKANVREMSPQIEFLNYNDALLVHIFG